METILKRLLDAELKAQQLVDLADGERERMVREALTLAVAANERFTARIPEIQTSLAAKAAERANQSVAEMQRRYEDHLAMVSRVSAEQRGAALEAALALVLDPGLA